MLCALADSCAGVTCTNPLADGNPCGVPGTGYCVAGKCYYTDRTCSTPPGNCYQPTGTCSNATAECVYPPAAPGTACSVGAVSGKCNGAGICGE